MFFEAQPHGRAYKLVLIMELACKFLASIPWIIAFPLVTFGEKPKGNGALILKSIVNGAGKNAPKTFSGLEWSSLYSEMERLADLDGMQAAVWAGRHRGLAYELARATASLKGEPFAIVPAMVEAESLSHAEQTAIDENAVQGLVAKSETMVKVREVIEERTKGRKNPDGSFQAPTKTSSALAYGRGQQQKLWYLTELMLVYGATEGDVSGVLSWSHDELSKKLINGPDKGNRIAIMRHLEEARNNGKATVEKPLPGKKVKELAGMAQGATLAELLVAIATGDETAAKAAIVKLNQ